jgi:PIN domain nuclease of toxin-antitoxin system
MQNSSRSESRSGAVAELYVLDTSAILAFTDQEEGAEEVERLLDAAHARQCRLEACAISLMELILSDAERGRRERGCSIGRIGQGLASDMDLSA